MRHLESGLHKISLELEQGKGKKRSATNQPSLSQKRLENLVETSSNEAYKKLINTAYRLALKPQLPLSTFELLVQCQRENGVKLIQGIY